ncbi:MAG: hypothetical protein DMG50_27870 [Acidobacteria bacterium]|nr:MAG: hypothetical protein DMG50_27870 [Acidobacteriota bacterium]
MKRITLVVLLIPLTLFEVYLCTAFLPVPLQRTINDHILNIFPKSNDWTPITHPLLSQEIEQVLREHIGFRIVLYAITVGLLTGNAWLIRLLWRLRGSAENTSKSR